MTLEDFKILPPAAKVPVKRTKSELDYLRDILSALDTIAKQEKVAPPAPKVHVEAPSVIVKPPEVVVNVPAQAERKIVRKWLFDLERDNSGQLKRIVATAGD